MASKFKHCDFCGKKELRTKMIPYEDKLLCDEYCRELYIKAYIDEEVKPKNAKGMEHSK